MATPSTERRVNLNPEPLTQEKFIQAARDYQFHSREAQAAKERRLAHEAAAANLGSLHNSLQAQHNSLQDQLKENRKQYAAVEQTNLAQSEKIIKIFLGRLFLANLSDKSPAGQKTAVPLVTTFLKETNNHPVNGPITCSPEGDASLTANGIAAIGSVLQKNTSWTILDISGARGNIDVQKLNELLNKYPNISQLILGKGHEATQRSLMSSGRKLTIVISEK